MRKKIGDITLGEIFVYIFKNVYRIVQIFPIFFLYYLYTKNGETSSSMANAFIITGGMSLLVLIFSYLTQDVIDRLVLSINLYIAFGGIAYLLQIYPLIRMIVNLQVSGVFASSVLVGFATILFSPYGFIGVKNTRRMIIYLYSFNLLSISVLVLTFSLHFQDSKFFGLFLPFICLYICNSWFKGVLIGKY